MWTCGYALRGFSCVRYTDNKMDIQKRKRNYYTNIANNQKKRKQLVLEPGMTGFLCTCNFHEKDCVRDAYKILNEFADELYEPKQMKGSNTQDDKSVIEENNDIGKEEDGNEEEDITTAFDKEIEKLKAEFSKPVSARRFQAIDTGVKNVIFVKTTLQNPLELVTKILTELDKTKKQRTRFLLRLLPVDVICKAYMSDIRTKASILLEKYFAQEPKTFSIIFNRHSNNNINRDEVIQDLAELVSQKNPGNRADLKNPELAVVVEVIRGVCLLSVVPNYYKYKKYNLLEICNTKETKNDAKNQEIQQCARDTNNDNVKTGIEAKVELSKASEMNESDECS